MNENREFDPGKLDGAKDKSNALRASLLAVAVLAVPAFFAIVAVVCWKLFVKPVFTPQPLESPVENCSSNAAAVEQQPLEGSLADRENLRLQGEPIGGANLKIWMQQANSPLPIFRVEPPSATNVTGAAWRWAFPQGARYVIAFTRDADAAGRRLVGLYDLIGEEWVWRSLLPWPEESEQPFAAEGRLLLAYSRNGRRFMLQVAKDGQIAGIDPLVAGKAGTARMTVLGGTNGEFVVDNVCFTVAETNGTLTGRAALPFPGFHQDGRVLEAFGEPRPTLDESVAQGYADVLSNLARTEKTKPLPLPYLALRAQLCVANQAWAYAAGYMRQMTQEQQTDPRAPRVNPLLFARCLLLAGQKEDAVRVMQAEVNGLVADDSAYNGKAREELERLLRLATEERGK